jgi:murein DD-endopeptidase MepM/ murein hydrolase activator NlpD
MAQPDSIPSKVATLRAHLFWLASGFLLPIAVGMLAYTAFEQLPEPTTVNLPQQIEQPVLDPSDIAKTIEIQPGNTVDFMVLRDHTLERIFRLLRIDLNDLAAIRALPEAHRYLDNLQPGERIAITELDGALQRLSRRINETAMLNIERDADGFDLQVTSTPVDNHVTTVHGVIDSSLFASGRAAGLSADLIMRLANDIFGWDIDFALEIRPNDEFTVVYEQKYRDGHYLGDGRVLAAEFVNDNRAYRAVFYESPDGKVADYFTPEGNSMRKQFLRAPVDFKYISSNFNPRRLHPILNIRRAHQGVDYAAATGTPIKASGDGRVSFIGVKGGYGKAIILEHGGSVSTLYAHLSRYSKELRPGTRVRQGEVIGYVGSTGTATASHLHYEYRVNGTHKNPRTVVLPDAKPIPVGYRAAFTAASGDLLMQLDKAKSPQVAASR